MALGNGSATARAKGFLHDRSKSIVPVDTPFAFTADGAQNGHLSTVQTKNALSGLPSKSNLSKKLTKQQTNIQSKARHISFNEKNRLNTMLSGEAELD
jgi:hypothetical protein